MSRRSSYKKLKTRVAELEKKLLALNSDLHTVVLKPDSFEASEIAFRVNLENDTARLIDMSIRNSCQPPFNVGGIISQIQDAGQALCHVSKYRTDIELIHKF